MPIIKRTAVMPHSAAQMYQLVTNVEDYPNFLPWCKRAVVQAMAPNQVRASIQMAKGPLQQTFTTLNTMVENQSVAMQYVDGPFSHLTGSWQFKPLAVAECEVAFELDYEFGGKVISTVVEPVFYPISYALIEAFQARAHEKYDVQ